MNQLPAYIESKNERKKMASLYHKYWQEKNVDPSKLLNKEIQSLIYPGTADNTGMNNNHYNKNQSKVHMQSKVQKETMVSAAGDNQDVMSEVSYNSMISASSHGSSAGPAIMKFQSQRKLKQSKNYFKNKGKVQFGSLATSTIDQFFRKL